MPFDAFLTYFLFKRKLRRIPRLSTEELKEMVPRPATGLVMGAVLAQLKERGEDVTFSLPYVAQLACSSNYAAEAIGVGCLRNYFPEVAAGLEIKGIRLTKQSKQRLYDAIDRS